MERRLQSSFNGIEGDHMGAFVEGMILRDYSYDVVQNKNEDDEDDGEIQLM